METAKLLRRISRGADLSESVVDIYLQSFPAEERRSVDSIRAMIDDTDSCFEAYEVVFQGNIVGLLTIWRFAYAVYVEHFAISQALRGKGLGGRVLEELSANNNLPLLLEVEPENQSRDAARRISFYRRHGFDVISTEYIQPSYGEGLAPVELWLMSKGSIVDLPTVITDCLYREVYSVHQPPKLS